MKACVVYVTKDGGSNNFNLYVGYFDGSTSIASSNIDCSSSGCSSLADLRAVAIAAIVNDAVNNQGLAGFTAADVLLGYPQVDAFELKAIDGSLASGVIDGKSTGQTTIFTVPAGKVWLPSGFMVRLITKTGAVLTPPVMSFGSNGSANDIAIAAGLTSLLGVGNFNMVLPVNNAVPVTAGNPVKVNVTVAAIGGTVYDFQVIPQGVLLDA